MQYFAGGGTNVPPPVLCSPSEFKCLLTVTPALLHTAGAGSGGNPLMVEYTGAPIRPFGDDDLIVSLSVIPAKAGIQVFKIVLDARLRGHDEILFLR